MGNSQAKTSGVFDLFEPSSPKPTPAPGKPPPTPASGLIGNFEHPCPICGGGMSGVARSGNLVCMVCNPESWDRYKLKIVLIADPAAPEGQYRIDSLANTLRVCAEARGELWVAKKG
ncbi:MAG: hypothetical protein GY832_25045 [Chloroflexi bacterium]|nr:hypothetical protein [Chloroflexota bacterium]